MAKEAVILINGVIVSLDQISSKEVYDIQEPTSNDVSFNNEGLVVRFKKNGIYYIPYFNDKKNFYGYFPEEDYWELKNAGSLKNSLKKDFASKFFKTGSTYFTIGSNIKDIGLIIKILREVIIEDNNLKISYSKNIYLYPEDDIIKSPRSLIIQEDITSDNDITNKKVFGKISPKYYLYSEASKIIIGNFPPLKDYYEVINDIQESSVSSIISDIVLIFHDLYQDKNFTDYLQTTEDFKNVFERHFKLVINTGNEITDNEHEKIFTIKYFSLLRIRLLEFRDWFRGINHDYIKESIQFRVRVVGLFNSITLSKISYSLKLSFFNSMINDNIILSGRFPWFGKYQLSEEEVVIKIIESIPNISVTTGELNYDEVNNFLNFLLSKYYKKENKTWFETLYHRISNSVLLIFGDDGAKRLFIKAVYNLWLLSKYNPYHEDSHTASRALNHFTYTPYNAQWNSELIDVGAAPLFLGYKSSKILLWYDDNFNFSFKDEKILAYQKVYRNVRDYDEVTIGGTHKSSHKTESELYGTYDIFQPISIYATNPTDTIIQLPVLNAPEGTSPEDMKGYINNCIPIFYLKYVDDAGDYSDFKETIGILWDIGTTLSGIGNIAKLRHLKNLSLISKFASGALSLAETASLAKAVKDSIEGVEKILEVVSLVNKLSCTGSNCSTPPIKTDPNYEECNICFVSQKWLDRLDILTLCGGFFANRAYKRATRDLNNAIQELTGEVFENLDLNQLKSSVTKINNNDKNVSDFFETVPNNIKNYFLPLEQDININKIKEAFMYDFIRKRSSTLENMSDETLDNWKDLFKNDIHIPERTYIYIIKNLDKTNTLKKVYAQPNLIPYFQGLALRNKTKLLDKLKTLAPSTWDDLNEYPFWIKQWDALVEGNKKELTDNISSWLRMQKARFKNSDELAELYNYDIHETPDEFMVEGNAYLFNPDSPDETDVLDLVGANAIAKNNDDIEIIVGNTGIPKKYVDKAKQNYFIKKRVSIVTVNNETKLSIGRFTKSQSQITQWNNAISGDFDDDFILLIGHEYVEGVLIDNYGLSFRSLENLSHSNVFSHGAHDLAPASIVRQKTLPQVSSMGRKNPVDFNFDPKNPDFSAWDKLIEQYVEIYNLEKKL